MTNGLNDRALLNQLNQLVLTQEVEFERLRHAFVEMQRIATKLKLDIEPKTMTAPSVPRVLRILLIEDDDLALLGVNITLSEVTCEIVAAKTMAEGLALLKQQVFDIVFCDMNLPDGHGLDIIDAVKQDTSGFNYHTPFIALTADKDKGKTLIAEQHGFDLYLVKPLTQESAKAVIDVYAYNLAADVDSAMASQENANDSMAVIDLEQAEAISGCDKQKALTLIGRLIHDFPEEQAALVQAYHENNIDAVRETLHRLRGGASYCGVPQLNAAINDLNAQVSELVDLTTIEPSFLRVYRELEAVKRVYESLSHSVH